MTLQLIGVGVQGDVKIPILVGMYDLVTLYGIGESSSHEIAFGIELGPKSIL